MKLEIQNLKKEKTENLKSNVEKLEIQAESLPTPTDDNIMDTNSTTDSSAMKTEMVDLPAAKKQKLDIHTNVTTNPDNGSSRDPTPPPVTDTVPQPTVSIEPEFEAPTQQRPAKDSKKERKYFEQGGSDGLYKKRLEKLKNCLIPELHQYAELLLHNEEVIDNVEFCIMDYEFDSAKKEPQLGVGKGLKNGLGGGNISRQ